MLLRVTDSKIFLLESGKKQIGRGHQTGWKMKNHQPRLRVVAWMLHRCFLVRQASFPARVFELLIRMAGIGMAMRKTGEKLTLAPEVCITLIAVEQRNKGRVKNARSATALGHGDRCPKCAVPFEPSSAEKALITRRNWAELLYIIVSATFVFQHQGVDTNAVHEMSEPSNAPDPAGRICARLAGSILRLLPLAMFRLQDGANA
jgi:hypothetical protein